MKFHVVNFTVRDDVHGDQKVEVQISTGRYRTVLTLIINGKSVAQTWDENWKDV